MSKAKHLPGPWEQTRTKYLVKLSASSPSDGTWHFFAKVCVRIKGEGKDDETGLANARLIAAAPELLEALKKLTMMARTSGGTAGPDAGLMEACAEAESAIAKATGETEKLPQQ